MGTFLWWCQSYNQEGSENLCQVVDAYDYYMETLGMETFDELGDIDPTNLKIVEVEEQRDQSINIIQHITQIDIFSFKLFISTPTQLRVTLQWFLDN